MSASVWVGGSAGCPATSVGRWLAIAAAICRSRSWSGDESDAIREDMVWFTALRQESPEAFPVCDAALKALARELERALEEEHQEAIRGWR